MNRVSQVLVSEIPQRVPVCVRGDDSLISVANRMCSMRRGAAVVEGAGGAVIGILTERDIMLRVDHTTTDWHQQPVASIMTPDPISLTDKDTIADALAKMCNGRFRHLPRVDKTGSALGIVSVRDILAYVAARFPREFLNLPPDPSREASSPWGG